MKSLFNLDSTFMQMLTRIGDFIIINFLCLVCCLPIITAGAAISATHRLMQDFVMENEGSIFKTFFRAFKENFKQATIVWMVFLVIAVALTANLIITYLFFSDILQSVFYVLLAVVALIVCAIVLYMFPLLTRYRNTLKETLRNAMVLMIVHPHRTLGMLLLHALPIIIIWLSFNVFLQTLIFWLFVGISFIIYMDNVILKGMFKQLEANN